LDHHKKVDNQGGKLMKKIAMLLTLVMVLAFGASVMAADVKIGGEVRYILNVPADDVEYSQATQVRLKVTANLDENTYAQWYVRDSHVGSHSQKTVDIIKDDPDTVPDETVATEGGVDFPGGLNFNTVYTAQLVHKIAGAGTVAVGYAPDYGSSAFAVLGGAVWGATGDETNAISFASEAFNGLSFQAMFAPTKDKSFFGGEVSYALPVLEGSSVGFSANKKGDADMQWAVIGSAPVGPATVYAEVGKTNDDAGKTNDDINVKNIGASVAVGPATLIGEMELTEDAGKTYLQATVPYKGISLNASYQMGDGYTKAGDDGKMSFWAKISF
jgi:hypothetical protein